MEKIVIKRNAILNSFFCFTRAVKVPQISHRWIACQLTCHIGIYISPAICYLLSTGNVRSLLELVNCYIMCRQNCKCKK